MPRLLAAWMPWTIAIAAPLFAPGDCGQCALEAGKVSLCRTHDKQESAQLKRIKRALRSKEEPERAAALRELEHLSAEHANAPSRSAAELIAAFLEEDSHKLRASAVEALLAGQHPEVVVAALSAEVKVLERDWKLADKYIAKWVEKSSKGSAYYDPKENAEFMRQVRVLQYGPAVLRALGKLPDERCSAALVDVLGWPVDSTPAILLLAAADSALELGTLAGAQAVVALLERLDGYLAKNPPANRYGLAGQARTLGEGLVLLLSRPMLAPDYAYLTAALDKAGSARGLAGIPTQTTGPARPWKDWLAANAAAFATELGTLRTPVQAQLASR